MKLGPVEKKKQYPESVNNHLVRKKMCEKIIIFS